MGGWGSRAEASGHPDGKTQAGAVGGLLHAQLACPVFRRFRDTVKTLQRGPCFVILTGRTGPGFPNTHRKHACQARLTHLAEHFDLPRGQNEYQIEAEGLLMEGGVGWGGVLLEDDLPGPSPKVGSMDGETVLGFRSGLSLRAALCPQGPFGLAHLPQGHRVCS